jgi:hypothetical protein
VQNFPGSEEDATPAALVPQEPQRGDHHQEDSDGDEQMEEINVIFEGSMSLASKTQGKKIQREISLAQRIEPGRRMRWFNIDISFGPEDHPDMELLDRNLPFIVKILIRCHKVAKTLINSGASLDLMMRKTFIEMSLNLADLTPVHDTFHGIIPRQSSTPIERIDLEVSCRIGGNKHREMLTFEVASFDIRYNCILGRPFLLKFMAAIHTAYATIKMSGPKCIIILKSDQRDALACENTTLTHIGRFGEKEAHELAVKVGKAHGGSTPIRIAVPKPPATDTHRPPPEKTNTFMGATSNQPNVDQAVDDKKKGANDRKVAVDPDDTNKNLRLGIELEAK